MNWDLIKDRKASLHEVIEAVVALSHDTSVPYLDYVLGLRDKPLARAVKTADLKHNSNLSRLKKVKPSDRRRYVKYQMALALLNDSADSFDSTLDPPLWRKRIPLDEQRMCFLSVFYDTTGEWRKLSLDVEESDSSYELSVTDAERLHELLAEGDRLIFVRPDEGMDDIVLMTKGGYFLRFALDEVAEQKKNSRGVRGMKLTKDDTVLSAWLISREQGRTVELKDRTLDLGSLKAARRDGKGTKIRK